MDATTRTLVPRVGTALAVTGVVGALSVASAPHGSPSGYLWPAGLATGALLWSPRRWTPYVALLVLAVAALSYLPAGEPPGLVLAWAVTIAVEAFLVNALVPREADGRAWLRRSQDVGRYALASTAGAAVGAAGFTLSALLTVRGEPWVIALAAFARHLAAQLIFVPLFLEVPHALARPSLHERIIRIGTTAVLALVVLGPAPLPGLSFLLLPVLGWSAFRAPLRENQLVMAGVAVIAAAFTNLGVGPFHDVVARMTESAELRTVPVSLFLIACSLVCVPFGVEVRSHREALRQVATERTRSDRLIHSAEGLVIIGTDDTGAINLFNHGAERVLGYDAAEVLGRSPEMFFSDAEITRLARLLGTKPTYRDVIERFTSRELLTPMDWEFVRKDGSTRILAFLLTPIHAADGQVLNYLGSADDMTERVHTQRQLERALVRALAAESDAVYRLAEVDRAKDSFVAAVSHELRTPITNLMGYLELLRDGSYGRTTPEQDDALTRIELNSRRLLALIDDLLALARIEQPPTRVQAGPVDLREVVQRAVDDLRAAARSRGLRVDLALPEAPVLVRGDAGSMGRMVTNLVDNAVKFTPTGGRIRVRLATRGGRAELEVEDTGIGIPEDEQPHVFNRFFRATAADEGALPGAGLGLFIARAIVEAHGGEVDFTSTPGEGTTFTVRIPLAAS